MFLSTKYLEKLQLIRCCFLFFCVGLIKLCYFLFAFNKKDQRSLYIVGGGSQPKLTCMSDDDCSVHAKYGTKYCTNEAIY
jgi:predicted membrane metal-binding protein